MLVYSDRIFAFVRYVQDKIEKILSQEMGATVTGEWFIASWSRHAWYRIGVVVHPNPSSLAYFDPNFQEIGFHESLVSCPRSTLDQIIRHELAHLCVTLQYGSCVPHGREFQEVCRLFGFGNEVLQATIDWEKGEDKQVEESALLRKVEKLMALSSSTNSHEAQNALMKAQQLLLRYHSEGNTPFLSEEKIYLVRILEQKRIDAKMRAIGSIMQTFFVVVVYSRARQGVYLELLGNKESVQIAEYVAIALSHKLEQLWIEARLTLTVGGATAKNSFFYGIARGYLDKIAEQKALYNEKESTALVCVEKQLEQMRKKVYPKVSCAQSRGGFCAESAGLGHKIGKELRIPTAVSHSATSSETLLLLE